MEFTPFLVRVSFSWAANSLGVKFPSEECGRVMVMARSTLHYKAAPKDDEDALRLAMIRLAKQYGRYGYRKIAELLRVEGWTVNHKKVE